MKYRIFPTLAGKVCGSWGLHLPVWHISSGFDALAELSAAQAGAFLYLEPIFTSIFAFLVLNEHIYTTTFTGRFDDHGRRMDGELSRRGQKIAEVST